MTSVDDKWLRTKLFFKSDRQELSLLLPGTTFQKGDYTHPEDLEKGLDLADLDFRKTTWQPGCVLTNARAERTNWNHADLSGCDLSGVQLQESEFRFTSLMNCTFTKAKLGPGTFFSSGHITGGVFLETNASNCHWLNWIFTGVTFDQVDFTHVKLQFCKFIDCTVSHCSFAYSVLDGFRVEGGTWSDIEFGHAQILYHRFHFHPAAHRNIPVFPKSYGETLEEGDK
jgi:uncharacterized protein YjbI with pentapeptide repeats